MDCYICKSEYTYNDHFGCMEVLTYDGDTVVVDLLNKKPEVFGFLLRVLKSQVNKPDRFLPFPTWFKKDDILNMDLFKETVEKIKPQILFEYGFENDRLLQNYVGEDAYMLLRFMILSCPINLEHVKINAWEQFKVTWEDTVEQKFEMPGKKPQYLYHGSPLSNWQSILRNGLKVTSGTSWMTTGAAFGKGIYASDTLNVSYGYSCTQSGPIVIGVYEIYEPSQYKKSIGIYVIPNENLMLLRYLIYVDNPTKQNIVSVDSQLKEIWNTKSVNKASAIVAKQKKAESRIRREIQILKDNGCNVTIINNTEITVVLGKFTYVIIFPFLFPFSAPIIKDIGCIRELWTPKSTVYDFLH